MTDYGLCTTVNGNSIRGTFKESERIKKFAELMDRRKERVTPET